MNALVMLFSIALLIHIIYVLTNDADVHKVDVFYTCSNYLLCTL